MTDLAERFAAVIDDLDIPDVDLVDRVLEDLARPVRLASRRSGSRQLLTACAAAILVVIAVLTLEPARSAVADFLGIGAVRFESGPLESDADRSTVPSSSTSTAPPAPVEEAAVNPIPSLGQPIVTDQPAVGRRTYSWSGAELPAVKLEVRTVDGPIEFKSRAALPGAEFLSLQLDGGVAAAPSDVTAIWIPTAHERLPEEGQPVVIAGPTLLWVLDDVQYRLEGDISRDAAITLAEEIQRGSGLLAED